MPSLSFSFCFRRAGGGRHRGTAIGCLLFTLGVLAWVSVMGSFPAFSSTGPPSPSAAAPARDPLGPASSAPGRTTGGLPAVHTPGKGTPASTGGGDRAAASLPARSGADANSMFAGGAPDSIDKPRLEIESQAADAGPHDQFPGRQDDRRQKGVRDGGGGEGTGGAFLSPEELGAETLADGKARCWTDEVGNSRCLPNVFFFGVSKCGEVLG